MAIGKVVKILCTNKDRLIKSDKMKEKVATEIYVPKVVRETELENTSCKTREAQEGGQNQSWE